MSKVCALPFIHLSYHMSGHMQLCTKANSSKSHEPYPGCNKKEDGQLVQLSKESPADYWNTEYYKNIRRKMVANQAPTECEACFREEALGNKSKRLWENEQWLDLPETQQLLRQAEKENGTIDFNLKYLELKFGNHCNLSCIMCNASNSSKWKSDYLKLSELPLTEKVKRETHFDLNEVALQLSPNTKLWLAIQAQLKNMTHLYILGGEPCISKDFRQFLKMCIDENHAGHLNIRMNTNGLAHDHEIINLLSKFKSVLIDFSLDSYESRNEYIRFPSKWENTLKALRAWDESPDNIKVDLDCSVQNLNVLSLPDFYMWKQDCQFKKINTVSYGGSFGMHFVWSPSFLSPQCLPPHLKNVAIEKIENLKSTLGEPVIKKYKKIDALINILKQPVERDWSSTVEYLDAMDSIRNTNWRATFPELT